MKKLLLVTVITGFATLAASTAIWPTHGSANEPAEGCNTGVAAFPIPRLDAPGTSPPVQSGDQLRYRATVTLPEVTLPEDPIEVLCSLTDVDVFIRMPGDRRFRHACRLDQLDEGETRACPGSMTYKVNAADAQEGRLRAQIRVMTNVHGGGFDCTIPEPKRNPAKVSDCVDATALMALPIAEASAQ